MAFVKNIFLKAGNYLLIIIGAVAYGAGVGLFLEPYHIAPGGVTGISIMVSNFTGISTGALILLINLPLLLLALVKMGGEFFVKTLVATAVASAAIDRFSQVGAVCSERMISAFAGGALMAASMGLIFRCGGTTGGSDIVVRLLRRRYPHIKSGTVFLVIDGIISVTSGLVFRNLEVALYALSALTVSSKVLDFVLYGTDEAKLVFIFSEKSGLIMEKILRDLDAGASFISGNGGYSGREEHIIMCALKKPRLGKLSDIVKETDGSAFMVVSSATEIYGVNFKGYSSSRL